MDAIHTNGSPWASTPTSTQDALAGFMPSFHATRLCGRKTTAFICACFVSVGVDAHGDPKCVVCGYAFSFFLDNPPKTW